MWARITQEIMGRPGWLAAANGVTLAGVSLTTIAEVLKVILLVLTLALTVMAVEKQWRERRYRGKIPPEQLPCRGNCPLLGKDKNSSEN